MTDFIEAIAPLRSATPGSGTAVPLAGKEVALFKRGWKHPTWMPVPHVGA